MPLIALQLKKAEQNINEIKHKFILVIMICSPDIFHKNNHYCDINKLRESPESFIYKVDLSTGYNNKDWIIRREINPSTTKCLWAAHYELA